jgi:putative endonuclease
MSIRNEIDSKTSRRQLGAYGESLAAKYLRDVLGWTVCEQNWRCRYGEIDIIALCRNSLVFVEVRTKTESGRFGTAIDSVNARKLRQIERLGRIYIHLHKEVQNQMEIRFDLVAMQVHHGLIVDFQHFRNIIC